MNEMRRLINICEGALDEVVRVHADPSNDMIDLKFSMFAEGHLKALGNMGKVFVYFYDDGYNTSFTATFGEVTEKNSPKSIAEILVKPVRPPRAYRTSKKPTYAIYSTEIAKKYTGFNLGPELYRHILKQGYILRSDQLQSRGGASVWNRLAQYPDITVFAQSPKHSYIELEPGDSGELEPVGTEVDTVYGYDPHWGVGSEEGTADEKDAVIYAAAK